VVRIVGKFLIQNEKLPQYNVLTVCMLSWKFYQISFRLSKNIRRRHLTESQRVAIAVDLLPYLEKESTERREKARGKKKE